MIEVMVVRLYHVSAHETEPVPGGPTRWECYVDEYQDVMFSDECDDCIARTAKEKISEIENVPISEIYIAVQYFPLEAT